MKRKVLVKQHDATDCGAACLSMICFYYHKELSITKLRDVLGTDIKGTTLAGLAKGAEFLGFETKALRVDMENFQEPFTLPAIAHVLTDEGLAHYIVIRKIKKGNVWISDPAKGDERMSVVDFYDDFDGILLLLKPTEKFVESKQKTKSVFDHFMKLILAQKKLFIYAIIASLLLTVFGIISSLFNKFFMDEILPYHLEKELLIYVIAFGLLGLTQAAVGFIRSHMLLYLSQKIDIPLVLGYFNHIFNLPVRFFATRKVGDILTRFSDSFTIKNVLTSIYLTIIIDVVMTVASGVILYVMNKSLFAVIVVITFISAILIYIFKRPYKKINYEQMEQSAQLNSTIIESLRGIEAVKGNANEEQTMEYIEKDYIKNLRVNFHQGFLSNIQGSINGVISTMGNLVLMYIGALQVMEGNITLGTLFAFTSLSGYFMEPIGRLISMQFQIQEASISMKRMSEILEVEEEQNTEIKYPIFNKIHSDIEIKNVMFRYGSRKPVLDKVSLTIPKGKKVALVGESGSGKTTLSKLLLRFFDYEDGSIMINHKEIMDYDIRSLRKSIGYVPQNVELFSGTVISNIRRGKPGASQQEVEYACELSGCDSFIEKLPGRYQTFLEEAGGGLSGGEKQRLAMARALVKQPEFLILDEATSNLDFISESKIYDTIFNKLQKTTMLIIAHRLSTIRNCDVIYVMDKGRVVEVGSHEQLLENKNMYYQLWMSQIGEKDYKDTDREEESIEEKDIMVYV
ncbi:peptidase domain-containing ABC transporter [Eubacterium callanderi]|nr:peptidase domain-containing ABC transporter [Eubacterium callanderi]